MILDFTPISSDTPVNYCVFCHKPNSLQVTEISSKKIYRCSACGKKAQRQIIIDPTIEWSVDKQKRYWHKSVGVLLVNEKDEILLFELTKFPYGFSFPAGHIDTNEKPEEAATRELFEETGVKTIKPTLLHHTSIDNDSCSRGSDNHEWWLFGVHTKETNIRIDHSEGKNPIWVSLNDVANYQKPHAADYLLTKAKHSISNFINESASS